MTIYFAQNKSEVPQENQAMLASFTRSAFITVLLLMNSFAHAETILSEEEVLSLISGNTVQGIHLGQNIPFENYFDPGGKALQQLGDERIEGEWFVDKQGRHCVKWENKTRKCRIVVRDKDEYREYTINAKTGKREYILIINKLYEGHPNERNN